MNFRILTADPARAQFYHLIHQRKRDITLKICLKEKRSLWVILIIVSLGSQAWLHIGHTQTSYSIVEKEVLGLYQSLGQKR